MLDKKTENDTNFQSSSKKGPLIGVFLILLSLAGYVFYTKSLASQVSVVSADITAKTDQIALIKGQIEEFDRAEEEYGVSTEVQRSESLKSVPAQMNQDEVIRDIVNISDSYDIELKSLSFGEGASDQEGIGVLSVNSSFEGNYNDLVSFLEGIEQNPRLFKVKTINVQINQLDVLDILRATFSLTMEAYYQL
jgi:Tfp pilus assembly protein PilO